MTWFIFSSGESSAEGVLFYELLLSSLGNSRDTYSELDVTGYPPLGLFDKSLPPVLCEPPVCPVVPISSF